MKSGWKNGRRSFKIDTPAVLQKKNGVCKIILMKNRLITGSVWYVKRHLQNVRCHHQMFRQHLWNFHLQSFLLKLPWMSLLPLSAWLAGLRLRSQRQLRLYLSGSWSGRCHMLNDASGFEKVYIVTENIPGHLPMVYRLRQILQRSSFYAAP